MEYLYPHNAKRTQDNFAIGIVWIYTLFGGIL